jgi:hypothetical protein
MAQDPKTKTARKASTMAKPKQSATRSRINLNKTLTSSLPSRRTASGASKGTTNSGDDTMAVDGSTARATADPTTSDDKAAINVDERAVSEDNEAMQVDEPNDVVEDVYAHLG